MARKYSIGIDLGTTNTVLAWTPLEGDKPDVRVLPLPQAVAMSQMESLPSLPSFLYLATDSEVESRLLAVPDTPASRMVPGEFARRNSALAPGRTVTSAKSWLCNPKVDRSSPILPWDGDEDMDKVSPVEASCVYLRHLVAEWNRQNPGDSFAEQRIALTVPASFDMAARELTRQAALQAGFPDDFVLLEEPQAALYHWMDGMGDSWRRTMQHGDTLLVCDVGGGTTDLTLLQVQDEAGSLELTRLAVGNHLLVGGDNMDLALAHYVAQKFAQSGTKLNPWQSVSLWHSCRAAKEALLGDSRNDRYTLSVLGRGSKLIGGTISIEIDREEVESLLLDGFLPFCATSDRPQVQAASGFLQLGLDYEHDTAITKHVAAFLSDQDCLANERSPKHLLFNGGAFKAKKLRDRLLACLGQWSETGTPLPSWRSGGVGSSGGLWCRVLWMDQGTGRSAHPRRNSSKLLRRDGNLGTCRSRHASPPSSSLRCPFWHGRGNGM